MSGVDARNFKEKAREQELRSEENLGRGSSQGDQRAQACALLGISYRLAELDKTLNAVLSASLHR